MCFAESSQAVGTSSSSRNSDNKSSNQIHEESSLTESGSAKSLTCSSASSETQPGQKPAEGTLSDSLGEGIASVHFSFNLKFFFVAVVFDIDFDIKNKCVKIY